MKNEEKGKKSCKKQLKPISKIKSVITKVKRRLLWSTVMLLSHPDYGIWAGFYSKVCSLASTWPLCIKKLPLAESYQTSS